MDEWRDRQERLEEVISHVDRAVETLAEQVRLAHDQLALLSERITRLERRLGVVEAAWDRDHAPATEPATPHTDDAPDPA